MQLTGIKLRSGHWFIIKAVALILLWKLAYVWVIEDHTNINPWLTNLVGSSTSIFFNWFGQNSQFDGYALTIGGLRSVTIAHACNGLELHALFLGFILITPGRPLIKVIYSLGGIVLIFLINVCRVYLLGLNYLNNLSTFEFNHKYTYLGMVYLLIFLLWIVWIEWINKKHFARLSQ